MNIKICGLLRWSVTNQLDAKEASDNWGQSECNMIAVSHEEEILHRQVQNLQTVSAVRDAFVYIALQKRVKKSEQGADGMN
jgi:hypothetical protein